MSERGEMSLAGLLVASTLFLGVMGATLSMFTTSERVNRRSQVQSETQAALRAASDDLARELRNAAAPAGGAIIERLGAHDLIVRRVNGIAGATAANPSGTMRVRWCLQGAVLRRMQTTYTTAPPAAAPASTACDGTGWAQSRVLVGGLRNAASGTPVFTYDAAVPADVSAVRLRLVGATAGTATTEVRTGVFLRNQNRAPVPAFQATPTATGYVLNASATTDPDGQALSFAWSDETGPLACSTVSCVYPRTGAHTVTLTVTDAGGMSATITRTV